MGFEDGAEEAGDLVGGEKGGGASAEEDGFGGLASVGGGADFRFHGLDGALDDGAVHGVGVKIAVAALGGAERRVDVDGDGIGHGESLAGVASGESAKETSDEDGNLRWGCRRCTGLGWQRRPRPRARRSQQNSEDHFHGVFGSTHWVGFGFPVQMIWWARETRSGGAGVSCL